MNNYNKENLKGKYDNENMEVDNKEEVLNTDEDMKDSDLINKNISGNRIELLALTGSWFPTSSYHQFGFYDMGDGSVRLRAMANNSFIDPESLPTTAIVPSCVIKFIDNTGAIYWEGNYTVFSYSIKHIAKDISNVKLRYGLDSIQIIHENSYDQKNLKIFGTVKSNLEEIDFVNNIRKNTEENYSFRIERDGLYAQYMKQIRLPENREYIIETVEEPVKVLSQSFSHNAEVAIYKSLDSGRQTFNLIYDNKEKAYKIKTIWASVIYWETASGKSVKISNGYVPEDAFWYLQRSDNNSYNLLSASNIGQFLNLDSNGVNISVAEKRNNIKQKFRIIEPIEKDITIGEWFIASKIDNNKVLDVNNDISHNDVTIWAKQDGNNQKWKFVYNAQKNAYKIISKINENNVLAWNDYFAAGDGRNVFITPFEDKNEHYWVLEDLGDKTYILKNYKDLNLVLDLYNSDLSNRTNIQVHTNKNTENQKFKLIR